MPASYLVREEHIPERPMFPAIDAHNHLWGDWNVKPILDVMDDVGVVRYCDLTANAHLSWGEGGYVLRRGDIDAFFDKVCWRYPGRFYGLTLATFARDVSEPLFTDADAFVAETCETLRRHVEMGACGLKVLKELGLRFRDGSGKLINVDDERLSPIWDEASSLGVPVLIHQADPAGFFEPVTPENEHHSTMVKYPAWSFADSHFPRKKDLLARRDNLIRRHGQTTFILPHVANCAEDLGYVGRLLDENPNVHIDFSARIDELGRQPYRARELFLHYADRILFGTDMPPSAAMYRCYFRFLETFDEYFFSPDYDGTFERVRWPIYGICLPEDVLAKVYFKNALRLIPHLDDGRL